MRERRCWTRCVRFGCAETHCIRFRLPLGLRGGLPPQRGLLGDAEGFLLAYPAVVFGALFGVGQDCVGRG